MPDMEDLYRLLRTGHVQAQGIVDTVSDPLLVLDSNLCVQTASLSFYETFKVERYDTIGQLVFDLGDGQWDIPVLRKLLEEVLPKASAIVDFEVEHDFPGLGRRTMLLTARKLHHPDHASRSILLSVVDVTDRYRRDAQKDLLFGELRHRMKNLLGVVQSIARHTASEGRTADEYRDDFLGRFGALVDAQDLAFSEQPETALGELFARVLAPYMTDPKAVAIDPAPPVELVPGVIQSLSLVLHELATNAAKYGALSQAGGRLRITSTLDGEAAQLRIIWVESGGPPVAPPVSAGFGTRLIESVTTYSVGGHVNLDYAASGLKADILIPLGNTVS